VSKRIYMSSPDVTELERDYLLGALASGWVAPLGPDVDAFEREMAEYVGRSHAVALSSGTAALHLALLAHGIGRGDVVLTSSMTFAATTNAILYTGAVPFFVDSEATSGNIDPAGVHEAIHRLAERGLRPAALLPVDLLGRCAAYEDLQPVADDLGVPLISDAAESLGASRSGRRAGSYGHSAAVSFNGNKIMTTSGGGMLLTDDPMIAERARYLATQARQPVAHYEHTEIGYNYRLSNLLAAFGRAQLARLPEMLVRRRAIRERYRQLFRTHEGVRVLGGDDREDNCWLTSIVVDPTVTGWTGAELSSWLGEDDIESRPLWKPMHLQPAYEAYDVVVNGNAEYLFRHGLTLPSGSVLTEDDLERVTTRIVDFLESR